MTLCLSSLLRTLWFKCSDDKYFLVMVDVFIVCFAGRIPFAFLEDIHQRFVRTYGRAVFSALPYGMNDEFSRVLSQQMEYYSIDPNADRINRLKGEMSQVGSECLEYGYQFYYFNSSRFSLIGPFSYPAC